MRAAHLQLAELALRQVQPLLQGPRHCGAELLHWQRRQQHWGRTFQSENQSENQCRQEPNSDRRSLHHEELSRLRKPPLPRHQNDRLQQAPWRRRRLTLHVDDARLGQR